MIKIYENADKKLLRSETYNFNFDKKTGFFARWGKTKDEDPQFGMPEIADIEITTICGGPTKIAPCPFCYKKSTLTGTNMSIDTFTKVIERLCKSITQIAFGADSTLDSNPDIWKIMEVTRERGIIPNITVANISDEVADKLAKYCGAVACSRYSDKNLCYDSVKRLTDRGMTQVNIHMLISEETFDQVLESIADIKSDPRLAKLNAIVFLSLKQKGRGEHYNRISNDKFKMIIDMSIEAGISFGFDSCSANKFMESVKDHPKYSVYAQNSEPCESSLFSTYIDVHGKFFPCSFTPDNSVWGNEGIDVVECNDFIKDVWLHPKTIKFREILLENNRNCPLYKI